MKIPATYRKRTRAAWDEHEAFSEDVGTIEVYESQRPRYSEVLGPDGEPLEYDYMPIGFDLRRR